MPFAPAVVFWLFLLGGVLATGSTEEVRHYRLLSSASSLDESLPGLRLVVYSASRAEDRITLRLGLFNGSPQPLQGHLRLRDDAIFLRAEAGFAVLAPSRVSPVFQDAEPETTLRSGTALVGEIEFVLPAGSVETAWKLQIPGFPPAGNFLRGGTALPSPCLLCGGPNEGRRSADH